MDKLDLRLTDIEATDVRSTLDKLRFPEGSYEIDAPKLAGGHVLVELIIDLSKIDVSLLDLLVGYLLGRGAGLSEIQDGAEKIVDLAKARSLTDRIGKPPTAKK